MKPKQNNENIDANNDDNKRNNNKGEIILVAMIITNMLTVETLMHHNKSLCMFISYYLKFGYTLEINSVIRIQL